jgi:hypothetical protein
MGMIVMGSWHNSLRPECRNGHEPTQMSKVSLVAHGQSCKFECSHCGRSILLQNIPGPNGPEERVIFPGRQA